MNKALFFFLFMISLTSAQTHHLTIKQNKVLWQQIRMEAANVDNIEKAIRSSGHFDNIMISEDQILCDIKRYDIDYKAMGKSRIGTSIYIDQMYLTGMMVIDLKEDRYRVTFKNLELNPKQDGPLGRSDEFTDFEFFSLRKKNTEFRPGFLRNDIMIFEYNFRVLADFRQKTDDDW